MWVMRALAHFKEKEINLCNLILQLKGKETYSWKLKRDTSTVLPVIQAFKREESGSLFEQVH